MSVPCKAVSRIPNERDGLSQKKSTFYVTIYPADPRFHSAAIGDNLSCGEFLKGEVLGSSNANRINNLPVDVEAVPPTVKG